VAEADPRPMSRNLPPQVAQLAVREREIATLIYRSGGMTAKDLEEQVSDGLSNSSIRSMLGRLCEKKILKRRKWPMQTKSCGKRIAFLYLPAIDDEAVKVRVLRQVAQDYFNGSLVKLMAQVADELLQQNGERPHRAVAIKRDSRAAR